MSREKISEYILFAASVVITTLKAIIEQKDSQENNKQK
ncbi:hypothetical protein HNR32_000759 [Pectinatus brassicae]|uniref:Uncharacterized protein n=1 Tax=Pectinatus brassicae TaxID=862415 RepID=A0A840UJ32_9FIRM|nr:hypothetical protein [Pectinatus brassicae]